MSKAVEGRSGRAAAVLAGRETVTAEDVMRIWGMFATAERAAAFAFSLGWDGDPDAIPVATVREWVHKAEASRGRVLDRQARQVSEVTFEALGELQVNVRLDGQVVGLLEATSPYPYDLARAPRYLGPWLAWAGDREEGVFAVSAHAGALLILRESGRMDTLVEPEWGRHVRPLDDEQIYGAQRVAMAKGWARDRRREFDLSAVDLGGLTEAEAALVEPRTHPAAQVADIEEDSPQWERRRQQWARVTVHPFELRRKTRTGSPQWTIKAIATYLGVSAGTVASWRSRGGPKGDPMPAPDGMAGRTPWWHAETIKAWRKPIR